MGYNDLLRFLVIRKSFKIIRRICDFKSCIYTYLIIGEECWNLLNLEIEWFYILNSVIEMLEDIYVYENRV